MGRTKRIKEDEVPANNVNEHALHNCPSSSTNTGLQRCRKSSRKPEIERSRFALDEENLVMASDAELGKRRSAVAARIPGRTDNDFMKLWRKRLREKIFNKVRDLQTDIPTIPSTGQIARRGSAMLETEDCLPSKTNPPTSSSTDQMALTKCARRKTEDPLPRKTGISNLCSDVYLQLWNSEVGESFRNIKSKVALRENASLETDPCVPRETLISNPYSDIYLRLWSSEVGESFRKIKTKDNALRESVKLETEACFPGETLLTNPYSDDYFLLLGSEVRKSFQKIKARGNSEKCKSSLTQFGSNSACTPSGRNQNEYIVKDENSKSHIVLPNAKSNSSCSNEAENSSKSALQELQLLLDFSGNMDTTVLDDDINDEYSNPL